AAEHGQPRALRGPLDALAQRAVPLLAAFLLETDIDEHGDSFVFSEPPPPLPVAPALPTFFLITSSTYFTPLPLYGSGGRSSRTAASVCPTRSRSALVSVTRFLSTLAATPFGSLNTTGCE